MAIEFKAWPKITRVENRRTPVFTEKIDGTNAAVVIDDNGDFGCQSRTRIITPESDNFGFAKWAYANKEELLKLGPGHHFGEWWGLGIQRGYGLTEKRFSLFNTGRWLREGVLLPSCVSVVPVLPISSVDEVRPFFEQHGSVAAPGWNKPEGACMFDLDTAHYFKIILDK